VTEGVSAAAPRSWWRPLVRPALVVVVSVAVGSLIVGFVGAIDWGAVATAFGRLSWGRSVQNDLSANLLGTVTPPPGDVVMRVAMFKSWGVSTLDGMAGVTLNMLTFFAVRLLMPSIGLVLLAIVGAETGNVGLAVLFVVAAVTIVVGLLRVLAHERWAVLLGRLAARVAQRLRRDADPDEWSRTVVDFRARVSAGLPAKLARSMVALVLMVLADATILTLALRFTDVGADRLPLLFVVGTFCTVYPLTVMPLFGFGILDATLLAAFTEVAVLDAEPSIVAALAIWRGVTLLGPLALGALVTLNWRRQTRTG
jgi:hypothetical protein